MIMESMLAQRTILMCAYRLLTRAFGPTHLTLELGVYWDVDEQVHKYLPKDKSEFYREKLENIMRRLYELENRECTHDEINEAMGLLSDIQDVALEVISEVKVAEYRIENSKKLLRKRVVPVQERRKKLLDIWLSGKYTARDTCADEEWEALGFPSFRAARESLIGTPDPTVS